MAIHAGRKQETHWGLLDTTQLQVHWKTLSQGNKRWRVRGRSPDNPWRTPLHTGTHSPSTKTTHLLSAPMFVAVVKYPWPKATQGSVFARAF